MRHGQLLGGPLEPCTPQCVIDCVCPGQGDPCQHSHYSFDDEDDRWCVDCFAVLYPEDEAA